MPRTSYRVNSPFAPGASAAKCQDEVHSLLRPSGSVCHVPRAGWPGRSSPRACPIDTPACVRPSRHVLARASTYRSGALASEVMACIRFLCVPRSSASGVTASNLSGSVWRAGGTVSSAVLPGRHVGEVVVVALRFPVGGLILLAEVRAARLGRSSASRHITRPTQVVRTAPCPLERLVSSSPSGNAKIVARTLAQLWDPLERTSRARARFAPCRNVPERLPSSRSWSSTVRVPRQASSRSTWSFASRSASRKAGLVRLSGAAPPRVVGDRVRQDEVAIGQPLHERACAEAVGAVVGEVASPTTKSPGMLLIRL